MDDQSAQYLGLGPVPLRSADLARILRSPAPQAPVVRHPASSTASLSTAEALRPTLTPAASPASELKPRHPLGPLKSMATDHADESERCVVRPLGRAGEQTSGGHRLDQCGPRQWIAEFLPRPRCGLPVGNHGRPVLWRAPLRRGSLPAPHGMRGRVRWSRGGPLLRGRRRRRTARPVPRVRAPRLALPIAPRRCGRLRLPHPRFHVRPAFEEALRTAREIKAPAPRCRVIFTVYGRKRLGRERRRTRQPRHASPPRIGVAVARPFGRALSLPLLRRPCSRQDSRTVQGKKSELSQKMTKHPMIQHNMSTCAVDGAESA
ncbi:hypothetical protein EES42_31120 [Streptomyces sp. ADI95-17]|nr:hypothetical protein EES42_31120 [Streptomyces sp. ADI95-17]